MIDSHSHSILSHDGKVSIEVLRDKAASMGAEYLAITEHLDRDYLYCGLSRERFIRQLNLEKYFRGFAEAKKGRKRYIPRLRHRGLVREKSRKQVPQRAIRVSL